MFELEHISTMGSGHIKDFSFSQALGSTCVLLSQTVEFLDEIEAVLRREKPLTAGSIRFCGQQISEKDFKQFQYITKEVSLYPDQTVMENVFEDWSFGRIRRKRSDDVFRRIVEEVGYSIDPKAKVRTLSREEQKITEILRCYHNKPKLLVIRELAGYISFESFVTFLRVLKVLNQAGTTVLYLTNQWEEAMKLSCDITVAINGKIYGTYSSQEVRMDPGLLFYLSLGAKNLLDREKTRDDELSVLQNLNQNIQNISSINGIQDIMCLFAQYLANELKADSVVIYMVDGPHNQVVDFVTKNRGTTNATDTIERLKPDAIVELLGRNTLSFFSDKDTMFRSLFSEPPTFTAVLCYPFIINKEVTLFLQINYSDNYAYTKRDSTIVKWVSQEMAVYIENSLLMGSSVLLRESHHRIKNNLQIIISLLEMEKESFSGHFPDTNTQSDVDVAFEGAINRIKCIAGIHDLLAKGAHNHAVCDMSVIVRSVCEFYKENAQITIQADTVLVPYAKAVSIALFINEMVCNSIKHNMGTVDILIKISKNTERHQTEIVCRDNGRGFAAENTPTQAGMRKGIGELIIDSIVLYELGGAIRKYNQSGAVTEVDIPDKALLPVDKREVTA